MTFFKSLFRKLQSLGSFLPSAPQAAKEINPQTDSTSAQSARLSSAKHRLEEARQQYDTFMEQHKNILIQENNAENQSLHARLDISKLGIVFFSALVSVIAIQITFYSWTAFSLGIWIGFLLAFLFAFFLLELAILLRKSFHTDQQQNSDQPKSLITYLYIIPLLFLPLIVLANASLEEHPVLFFIMAISAIIAFFLNLAITRYHRQFALMREIKYARKLHKRFRGQLSAAQAKVSAISNELDQT